MKRFIVLCVSGFMILAFQGECQERPLEIGLNAGYGWATIFGENTSATGSVQSNGASTFGVSAHWRFSEQLGILIAPAYSKNEVTTDLVYFISPIMSFAPNYSYSISSEYLSVPLLFRAQFGDKYRFFAQSGPQFDFLLKRTTTADLTWPYQLPIPEDPNLGTVHKDDVTASGDAVEINAVLGAGVNIEVTEKITFDVELRGVYGLKARNYGYSFLINENSFNGNFAQGIIVVGVRYLL